MIKLNQFWSLSEGTFYCLYDQKRTLSFRKAIHNTVKEGDVVADIGSGTGVLSMFAIDAGAKKVYAVEYERKNFTSLKETIKSNNLQGKIVAINSDATSVKLPEKVDVIICEMIATGLLEELQVPAMNNILKYAKKEVRVVLKEYEIYLDLVFHKDIFYDHKFKIISYEFPDKKSLRSKPLSKKEIVEKFDFSIPNKKNYVKKTLLFDIFDKGIINGIRISTKTIFYDGSSLDHSLAYSFPIILPIDRIKVKRGDKFEVSIYYKICKGPRSLKYSIKKV